MEEYEEVYAFVEFPELEGLDIFQSANQDFQLEIDKDATAARCHMKNTEFKGEFELNLGTMLFFNEYMTSDGKTKTTFVQSSQVTLPMSVAKIGVAAEDKANQTSSSSMSAKPSNASAASSSGNTGQAQKR